MCGLTGYYPKKNKQANISKLLSMWVINEARGTDSCGITIGDTRFAGTGIKESKVRDFLESSTNLNDILKTPLKNKPIIAHTRASTNGSHNNYNAHPFIWTRKNSRSFYFCFAHNGVIRELPDFKHKLGMSRHDKDLLVIDSHVLGLAMYDSYVEILTEKEILTSYEGNAAFLCYDNKTFKAWKGANYGVEERPLFYVETAEGWYFHSIKIALELSFPENDVLNVENNTLLTFKNYELEKTEVFERKVTSSSAVVINNTKRDNKHYGYHGYPFDDAFDDDISYESINIKSNKDSSKNFISKLIKFNLNQLFKATDSENFEILLENHGEHSLQYITDDGIVVDGTYSFIPDEESGLPTNKLATIPKKGLQLMFSNGHIIKNEVAYKNFLNLLKSRLSEHHSYSYIISVYNKLIDAFITDIVPLKTEGSIDCVLFRTLDNKIDFITKNDEKDVYVSTAFGNYKRIQAINNALNITDV